MEQESSRSNSKQLTSNKWNKMKEINENSQMLWSLVGTTILLLNSEILLLNSEIIRCGAIELETTPIKYKQSIEL